MLGVFFPAAVYCSAKDTTCNLFKGEHGVFCRDGPISQLKSVLPRHGLALRQCSTYTQCQFYFGRHNAIFLIVHEVARPFPVAFGSRQQARHHIAFTRLATRYRSRTQAESWTNDQGNPNQQHQHPHPRQHPSGTKRRV